ncbi:hypothetical protein CoNPh11_CDS0049 [Staphylococcus phage S-CoN_Ph11]|nr:hypothetical protein CoNPh1_CDS0139 [Staphylococcus phage S-CoN_Ph1]WNM51576.1 hypothetical protein CoNPh2_CDS0021 [Staphylococcus phage S-CoN_Ph2]WNM52203.1 hypothetical protein CoNPh5_CDS0158 [Staphylococcus phage S-CoN_Ph5]WNM52232.1 hypothetical protein CoNPh6_CDS0021 [Staphylococcus phage S-CoN_Ph6]WNM52396.1 hypothetical protein CoNPh7_CDS0023 [Staphylococcus phage S-CoN_Ph7]WNM52709.1 hypothetical protein CoNPh8_CDS0156 [Staphylococcus phage S-CoN_Ph8]WNM53107.1 hypothetical protein
MSQICHKIINTNITLCVIIYTERKNIIFLNKF